MSESESAAAPTPATSSEFDKGPVSIKWDIGGDHQASVDVNLLFENQLMASNTLSPGDTNWNTGRHESSDGWCEASFDLQVPTPGQQGQLRLDKLTFEQSGGGPNTITNQLLATWHYQA